MPKLSTVLRRGIIATALCLASAATSIVAVGEPASAATPGPYYVCGGVKHGTNWFTADAGGYTGSGCGSSIDWHSAPAGSSVNSYYYFPTITGHHALAAWAWIPENKSYSNAQVHFSMYCGSTFLFSQLVNEGLNHDWYAIGSITFDTPVSGCTLYLKAWSDSGTTSIMGLDAVEMDLYF